MIGKKNIDRILLVGFTGALVWIALFARLAAVQVVYADDYREEALNQHRKKCKIQARRGNIYGRGGEVMATNSIAYSFHTTRKSVTNVDYVDSMFAAVLDYEPGYVKGRIEGPGHDWIYLARDIDPARARKLRVLESDSVFSDETTDRVYPYGNCAGQLLGFVNVDGNGQEGLELFYEHSLGGVNGEEIRLSDAGGRTYSLFRYGGRDAIPGHDLHITIDPDFQQIVEAELADGVDSCRADGGMAVFLKPSTGEILAMASYPGFDPNNPGESEAKDRKLHCITDIYEPGSTFKIVPFSALLQNNAVSLSETVDCEDGAWFYCNDTIHDAEPHGKITAKEVLVHSSNIGTIKLAERMAHDTLYSYARAYGFGSPTNVDLPGEEGGILHRPGNWSGMTPAAFPMGHEVAVTAIQVATAYAALANRGVLVRPYLLRSITDRSGNPVERTRPREVRKVMEKESAEVLCRLLEAVVDSGTGVRAQIEGLSVAGKTGTAQKVKEHGGYYEDKFVSSFVGFAPVESPEIVGVVVVDNPRKWPHWGGWTAAPIWRRIVNKGFATGVIDIASSEPEKKIKLEPEYVAVPDVRRMTASQALEVITHRGLDADTMGNGGSVASQSPLPGRRVPPGSEVRLVLKKAGPGRSNKVEVPETVGMPIRDATVEFAMANVRFRVIGSGIVKEQNPPAGELIDREQVCLLSCEIPKTD